jgi:hypothetical protein
MSKELINYNNNLYWVYRKVKQSHIKQDFISEMKGYWLCDLVVRDRNSEQPNLLFLREISDAVIVKNLL